jgi:hypothetical protein
VYRQKVERAQGDIWDPRNSMTLGNGCHSRHHNSTKGKLPLTAIPSAAIEFAYELLGPAAHDYLKRRYAGTDPRVEALLDG